MRRFILETGMGNDLHGRDYTKAAGRAVEAALRRSTLPIFATLDIAHDDMDVRVTIGAQHPDRVDTAAIARLLPRGRASVTAGHGGLDITNPESGEVTVIVTAAIEAFLPEQAGWRLTSRGADDNA
ncbi:Lin0512 family protein [Oceaniglobus indicus]|uniref:Lin0512 family protein n=1 Tax=Oceaniglobus indicus TaxID=2047749 RepID=UPI000C19C2D5|nr:Lin0512 family protein [Oceaniglobus indicus]